VNLRRLSICVAFSALRQYINQIRHTQTSKEIYEAYYWQRSSARPFKLPLLRELQMIRFNPLHRAWTDRGLVYIVYTSQHVNGQCKNIVILTMDSLLLTWTDNHTPPCRQKGRSTYTNSNSQSEIDKCARHQNRLADYQSQYNLDCDSTQTFITQIRNR
jgi:hypothetical protein